MAVHSEVQAAVQIIDQCSKCAILVSMLQVEGPKGEILLHCSLYYICVLSLVHIFFKTKYRMYRMFCPSKSRYATRKFHDLVLDNDNDYDDIQGWIIEVM